MTTETVKRFSENGGPLRVLCLEDDAADADLCMRELEKEGSRLRWRGRTRAKA